MKLKTYLVSAVWLNDVPARHRASNHNSRFTVLVRTTSQQRVAELTRSSLYEPYAAKKRKIRKQALELFAKGWTLHDESARNYASCGWDAPGRHGYPGSISQGVNISFTGALQYQCAAEGHSRLLKNKDGSANCSRCFEWIDPSHIPYKPRKPWIGKGSTWAEGYYDRRDGKTAQDCPYDDGQVVWGGKRMWLCGWLSADRELKKL